MTEVLKRLRFIELKTRGLVSESLGGEYRSTFKGQGIDFDDFREYEHGDEVRSIDWNVTARMGMPYIKKFAEERELNVIIMIDISASGSYGSLHASKREFAAEVGAALAFSAVANQDRVGQILFSNVVEDFLPPKKGHPHATRLLRHALMHASTSRGTDPKAAFELLINAVPRRSLVFLISDFLADNFTRPLRTACLKHDVIALHIMDPGETRLPKAGRIRLEDPETGQQRMVDTTNPKNRATFVKHAIEWQKHLGEMFTRLNIDHKTLRTDKPYAGSLRTLFQERDVQG